MSSEVVCAEDTVTSAVRDRLLRFLSERGLGKVIIHGYRHPPDARHGNTFHWIHVGYERALRSLLAGSGIEIALYDQFDLVPRDRFRRALILGNLNTDGVGKTLPIVRDSHYILHTHSPGRTDIVRPFRPLLQSGRALTYEVFRGHPRKEGWLPIEGEPLHYLDLEAANAIITWATDLLPEEVEENQHRINREIPPNRDVVFVGSIWDRNAPEIGELAEYCGEKGLVFEQYGGFSTRRRDALAGADHVRLHERSLSPEENAEVVRSAYLAPALQGQEQISNPEAIGNYIPCRILKNVSYGALGVSNNRSVVELLGSDVVYGENVRAMMDAAEALSGEERARRVDHLMRVVKDRHTYVNRIETLVRSLETVEAEQRRSPTKEAPDRALADHARLLSFWVEKIMSSAARRLGLQSS